eukprot:1928081-Rhodomonas_salina.2
MWYWTLRRSPHIPWRWVARTLSLSCACCVLSGAHLAPAAFRRAVDGHTARHSARYAPIRLLCKVQY